VSTKKHQERIIKYNSNPKNILDVIWFGVHSFYYIFILFLASFCIVVTKKSRKKIASIFVNFFPQKIKPTKVKKNMGKIMVVYFFKNYLVEVVWGSIIKCVG
jgi:hypothetical protein